MTMAKNRSNWPWAKRVSWGYMVCSWVVLAALVVPEWGMQPGIMKGILISTLCVILVLIADELS